MKTPSRDAFEIIAVRHAVAFDAARFKGPDRDRPLTKEGRKKFERALDGYMAAGLPEQGIVATSTYRRAQETAGLLAARLECEAAPCIALEPGHTPPEMLRALSSLRRRALPVYAVGHNPGLSEFVAACIGATSTAISLKKGGMAKIRFAGDAKLGSGELAWLLTPGMLRGQKPSRTPG